MDIHAGTLHHAAHVLWRRGVPVLPRLIDGLILLVCHATVPHRAVVGPGTHFVHRGLGVVVHPSARIGACVWVGPHVVIGAAGQDQHAPIVGDRVNIGASALIIGGVRVGERAVVGAGAVVISDVPAGATVVGNPARVLESGPGASTPGSVAYVGP